MKKFNTTFRMSLPAAMLCGLVFGCAPGRVSSLSIFCRPPAPDVLPLGSVSRAHWHTMETNGEASDFILYRNEFVDHAVELSPYGRDHIMEIAARMPSVPFPVLVQRSEDDSNPQLDAARRDFIVRRLIQLGNPDADGRTVVSMPYSDGIHSREAEQDRAQFRSSRQPNGFVGGDGRPQVGF